METKLTFISLQCVVLIDILKTYGCDNSKTTITKLDNGDIRVVIIDNDDSVSWGCWLIKIDGTHEVLE